MGQRLNERKFAYIGDLPLPRPCKHPPEVQMLDQCSYNDGGLRVVVHEWVCLRCHRCVRRELASCDVLRDAPDPVRECM